MRPSLALTLAYFGIAGLVGCTGMLNDSDVIRVNSAIGFETAQEWTRRGAGAVHRGKLDSAEASFKNAIRVDETYGPAHNNLGRVYFQKGNLKRAAEAFSWAMEFMPGRPEPMNNLGLILDSTGKRDEAIELFRSAHALKPEDPEYLANLVKARILRGDSGTDVLAELQTLKLIENRPDWTAWVDQHLALANGKEMKSKDLTSSGPTTSFPFSEIISSSAPTMTIESIGPELTGPNNDQLPESVSIDELDIGSMQF